MYMHCRLSLVKYPSSLCQSTAWKSATKFRLRSLFRRNRRHPTEFRNQGQRQLLLVYGQVWTTWTCSSCTETSRIPDADVSRVTPSNYTSSSTTCAVTAAYGGTRTSEMYRCPLCRYVYRHYRIDQPALRFQPLHLPVSFDEFRERCPYPNTLSQSTTAKSATKFRC